jgi:spore coat protein U-like protein
MRKFLMTAATAAMLAGGTGAQAVTTTTTFQVQATVPKLCLFGAGTLNFGTYTPGSGTAATGTTTLNVNCTKTTTYTVTFNAGSTTGGTVAQRLLANGANTLQYNLYTTNTYATIYGDGTGGTANVTGAGSGVGTANAVTIYGQLPDNAFNQNAAAGTYTDTITMTITY